MNTQTTPLTECRDQLTIRDFTYVYDREVRGQSYQNGPYLILVGRSSYCVAYKGQTFGWGYESITEALRAVNGHVQGFPISFSRRASKS